MSDLTAYVGCDPATMVPFRVLAHSLRRHSSRPLAVVPMVGPEWEYDTKGLSVGTAFSLRRWLIPSRRDWQGVALYLDADVVCLESIDPLFDVVADDRPQAPVVWCTHQTDRHHKKPVVHTSVMLIDCAKAAGWWGFREEKMFDHLRRTPDGYHHFMRADWLVGRVGELGREWNALDKARDDTRLLHYTKVDTQPFANLSHPHQALWEHELARTITAGDLPKEEFEDALARYHKGPDKYGQRGLHPHYAKYRELFS